LLSGKVALITGGNSGIGLVTARELARRGAHVFLACRSPGRSEAARQEILKAVPGAKAELIPLDLADFDSVRCCARDFLGRNLPLYLLINNAGLAGSHEATRTGFEIAFGVNHLGHFLLTELLLERIKSSAPARIVTVASRAHYRTVGIEWNAVQRRTRTFTAMSEYAVSKLANVLFSAELGRRLAGSGVTTYSLHPGVVATGIWRRVPWPARDLIKLFMISPEEGAATTLYCATSPEVTAQTGLYYDQCKVRTPSDAAQDTALAAELWRRSEGWTSA
jgi:NAD(P)-dependent dehydrogenase (short-subunit alcohol dehydrogenase family)